MPAVRPAYSDAVTAGVSRRQEPRALAGEATRLLCFKHVLNSDSSVTTALSCGLMAKKRKPVSKEEQRRRFEEAAREAGVDTSDVTLERIVRQIAKPAPKPVKATKKR